MNRQWVIKFSNGEWCTDPMTWDEANKVRDYWNEANKGFLPICWLVDVINEEYV